ncbi:FKBP-type peptidyl-prolyl cis-trans isomerase [Ketobacter alkanivorans]|uniref:Peptidyl-prolyl cis-trans isomerase n=1 Tax=Ketobacter alkanivorans TaxID=1917421 RepID=A0A2K9LIA2_9GAMM|nr:FKBP-type peptidyl-prolyl cis-trans isomerase [Ketobacter alkanivorans]AUM11967.1 peptidylprolyl isomerase [Ketobacter alkanivorans]
MSEQRIGPGKRVTLHFSVLLMDGSVVDTTKQKAPATFTVGDGNLLPGFEQSVFGLKAGDKRSIVLEAENAFGPHNPDNIQTMRRGAFSRDMALEPGLIVSFADKSKAELPGLIQSVTEDQVVVDFNHPLAGKDLTFQVEIINVVDADSQAVQLQ